MKRAFLFVACLSVVACQVLNCPPLPPRSVPTNISDLHPNDIKVVMALGDSVTAGFGIMGKSGLLNEYRGQSWSIGGDHNATTLANFLQFYSPKLQGSSLGHHLLEPCFGILCPPLEYRPSQDVLNAAQSGAMVDDLAGHELDYMIKQLKANRNINFAEDWKHLTLFIGANDLCASCTFEKSFLSPAEYYKNLFAVLERVRTSIPRVFVSIVDIFNISQIYDLSLKTPRCVNIHRLFFIECDCIFRSNGAKSRLLVDEYAVAYNQKSREAAAYYQSQNYLDFAVVIQPFTRDLAMKDQPSDMLSTFDCFHPSLIAHQALATGLWNSLLTPAAMKKTNMNITDTPLCPTADTLLYTY